MSKLVYKLKGLKPKVNDWEKKNKLSLKEELYEIDSGIITLMKSISSGIFDKEEFDILLSRKNHKGKTLDP